VPCSTQYEYQRVTGYPWPNSCATDEISDHDFGVMACMTLDEALRFRSDYLQHQPAHVVRDPNGRAYDRPCTWPNAEQSLYIFIAIVRRR
jgi:hypothetical protein